MYKTIALLLLCCGLNSACLFAQSADEKEVAARVEEMRKAMVAADTITLTKLAAPELSYGHSNGLVEDRAAFENQFITGKSVFVSLMLSNQTIKISGDVAIVRHHFTGDTNNDKVPGKVDLVVLQIWQKQHGNWYLLARQAAKLPVMAK